MGRKRVGVSRWRRWRSYRASALCRHHNRVRWLLAQRTRLRNYLRRFARLEDEQK